MTFAQILPPLSDQATSSAVLTLSVTSAIALILYVLVLVRSAANARSITDLWRAFESKRDALSQKVDGENSGIWRKIQDLDSEIRLLRVDRHKLAVDIARLEGYLVQTGGEEARRSLFREGADEDSGGG